MKWKSVSSSPRHSVVELEGDTNVQGFGVAHDRLADVNTLSLQDI